MYITNISVLNIILELSLMHIYFIKVKMTLNVKLLLFISLSQHRERSLQDKAVRHKQLIQHLAFLHVISIIIIVDLEELHALTGQNRDQEGKLWIDDDSSAQIRIRKEWSKEIVTKNRTCKLEAYARNGQGYTMALPDPDTYQDLNMITVFQDLHLTKS